MGSFNWVVLQNLPFIKSYSTKKNSQDIHKLQLTVVFKKVECDQSKAMQLYILMAKFFFSHS
jgi:hypothetical protein